MRRAPGAALLRRSRRLCRRGDRDRAEAARAGVAPAAILLGEPDAILAVGAAVADELYQVRIPVLVLRPEELASIPDGAPLRIHGNGRVTVE